MKFGTWTRVGAWKVEGAILRAKRVGPGYAQICPAVVILNDSAGGNTGVLRILIMVY